MGLEELVGDDEEQRLGALAQSVQIHGSHAERTLDAWRIEEVGRIAALGEHARSSLRLVIPPDGPIRRACAWLKDQLIRAIRAIRVIRG